MDNSQRMNFGDLTKEERYKKLERNLKLTLFEHLEQMKANNEKNYCESPSWPDVSVIHSEGTDSSVVNNKPNLQTSRIESDIVSSSTNLRKVLPVNNIRLDQASMVTSSVKKFSEKNNNIKPISLHKQVFYNIQGLSNDNLKYNMQDEHTKLQEFDKTISDSSKKTYDSKYPSYRIFSHWRVILNNQGKLIIKGILECGKIARSKPILQRLTSNKIQSIYKHIYYLNGNIVDERSRLPNYVRGKFYNGFPDDWENVYQLWRNYVAEGCPVTFRWPTRITDSDDDLNSEISDLTYSKNKEIIFKKPANSSKNAFNNQSSLGYHFKFTLDNQNLETSKEKNINYSSPKSYVTNRRMDDSGRSSEIKCANTSNIEYVTNNNSNNIHSTNTNCNSDEKNVSYLYEIIREDKVKIILSNLGDKNCSPQYFDKFIEFIDCLKYILSYKSNYNCEKDSKNHDITPSKPYMQGCQKCNSTPSFSEVNQTNSNMQYNVQNQYECLKLREMKKNSEQKDNIPSKFDNFNNEIDNNSSNSDTCMGIPKINLDRILKSKVRRCIRYKSRKNVNKGKQFREQITSVQDQKVHSDTCISISEHEYMNEVQQSAKFKKQRLSYMENMNSSNVRTTKMIDEIINECNNVTQQTVVNNKPIIKSCKPVYIDLKRNNAIIQNKMISSEFTTNSDRTPMEKKISNTNDDNKDDKNDENNKEEKLNNEILQHPFLTYDSEDFENEDELNEHLKLKINSNNQKISPEENKMPWNNVAGNNRPFGSKDNPKLLMSWMPYVVHNKPQNEYNLKFKGKLLNEAGHILHRKFITDSIHQRHSLKLVETINHEYFELVGEFVNKNHVVPKELLKQCYAGCPLKIQEFCQEFIKLKSEIKLMDLSNSINDFKVPISSRGRHIVPPLNYWQGERISTKDNDIVYNPGSSAEPSLTKKKEELKKKPVVTQKSTNKKNLNKKTKESPKKRFKVDTNSPSSLGRQILVKNQIELNSTSSTSSAYSDNEYRPREINIERVNNYTKKLRVRNQLKESPKLVGYNTRKRASTMKPAQLEWMYGKVVNDKKHKNDPLSDDMASLR